MQPDTLYLLNHNRENLLLRLLVLGQEHQTGAVFAFLRNGNTLEQDKLMRDLQHDAGTIARLVVCPFSATMAHVLKHFQCVVYQFVAFVAVNVDHHTNTTGIMFVVC